MNNILMNAPMALATYQGIKTHTRRGINIPKDFNIDSVETTWAKDGGIFDIRFDDYDSDETIFIKPPYKIGQVLWVREPAKVVSADAFKAEMKCKYLSDGLIDTFDIPEKYIDTDFDRNCDGDKDEVTAKWIKNCQGIPNGCIREMARTFIRVTNIRVERLNEISEEDAELEGIAFLRDVPDADETLTAKQLFYCLWEGINGNNTFDNRWVWVIEYELISKEEATK